MIILSLDPSGNFKEGKGTTGFAFSQNGELPFHVGDIKATDFTTKQEYWKEHELLITTGRKIDVLVIESYRLFAHKAKQQVGSSLETAQLIGFIEMLAHDKGIKVVMQDPSTKLRHSDDVLLAEGIIKKFGTRYLYAGKPTNMHQRDAIRHNLYYCKYGVKK